MTFTQEAGNPQTIDVELLAVSSDTGTSPFSFPINFRDQRSQTFDATALNRPPLVSGCVMIHS
jgi:hypothetical protein